MKYNISYFFNLNFLIVFGDLFVCEQRTIVLVPTLFIINMLFLMFVGANKVQYKVNKLYFKDVK